MVAQPLQVDRRREPRERRRARLGQPEAAEVERRETAEGVAATTAVSPHARATARSSARARRASISWPQTARTAACVTVARRSGR